MKSLQKLKAVFDEISISDEQKAALDEFFAEFHEKLETRLRDEIAEEYSEATTDLDNYVTREQAIEALRLQREDLLEDGERAFELATEDLKKELAEEYSERYTQAIEEMYESVLERASRDFDKSDKGQALESVKKAIQPLISSDETLLEEVESLRSQVQMLTEEKSELSRKDLVSYLVSDISDEGDRETVMEFVEGARSEEEIYERFNTVMALIEKRSDRNVVSEDIEEEIEDVVLEDDAGIDDDSEDEEPEAVFESETTDVQPGPKRNSLMSPMEEQIVDRVFRRAK